MCGPILFLLFTLPALELILLFQLGAQIGFFPTVILITLTAGLGAQAARGQGREVLLRLRDGVLPARLEILDGPLLLLAALLLIFPGFISDFLGALLLIPPLRRLFAGYLIERFGSGPGGPGVIVIRRPQL